MSPQDAKDQIVWTVEALRHWASDLFSATRREGEREIRRLDERIERERMVRDDRLSALEKQMEQRLEEERLFRERVTEAVLTRADYQREHTILEAKLEAEAHTLDAKLSTAANSLEKRVSATEAMLANIQGKAVAFAILGSIFLATVTAFITHVLSS